MIKCSKQYYESINCTLGNDSSDSEDVRELEEQDSANSLLIENAEHAPHELDTPFDWPKFLLVVGKAGTGKSYAIAKLIDMCVTSKRNVMVATLTGYLATEYKDKSPDETDAETIHAAFHYPVSGPERATFNWNLSNYDMLIIDELSMVPVPIFDHIFSTVSELPIRPVVVLAGDDRQLQPIETSEGNIQTTKSVMASDNLKNISMKVLLTEQHRTDDDKYAKFLDHIRLWQPSQKLLNEMQKVGFFLIMIQQTMRFFMC